MKYLLILAALALTGCGFGYEVKSSTTGGECLTKNPEKIQYSCQETKPLLFFNNVLKVCDTKEECNDYCDQMRKK